ncbi:MAG: hypothetical protein IJ217_00305, partial [Clostridia bacterium]|nr:hypothetical protein [Clostridia bacterium]
MRILTKTHGGVHTHSYGSWSNNGGTHIRKCSICGDTQSHTASLSYTYISETLHRSSCSKCTLTSRNSHDWNAGVVTREATCSAEGVKTYTCSTCRGTKTESIAKIAHTDSAWQTDDDQHWKVCTVCGEYTVAKTNHADANGDGKCDTCGYQMAVAPSITLQPTAATVSSGSSASFTTASQGRNLTYQWYYSSTNSNTSGTAITASNTGATASGQATATLTLSNIKTNLNNYYIYCVVTNELGTARTNPVKITVNKLNSTNPTLTETTSIYDGQPHAIGTSGGDGGNINYSTSTDNTNWGAWSTTVPSLTDIGTIYVRAYVAGDSEHNDTTPTASKRIRITQRPIDGNVTINLSQELYTYDAKAKEPTVTVTDSTLGITLVEGTHYTKTYSNNKNAGTATVTLTGAGIYTGTTKKTFTINPAPVTITVEGKTVNYNGSIVKSNTAKVTGVNGGTTPNGAVTYEYFTDSSCSTQTSSENGGAASNGAEPVNAGTYYVKATIQAQGNYAKTTSSPATITINRINPTFSVSPTSLGLITGENENVTITYN